MKPFTIPALLLVFLQCACGTSRNVRKSTDDGKLQVVFVQVNDVYEIAPVEKGKYGGMARVASLKKHYLDANKNTFLVMAGDFLSPSIYNSLVYDGKRVRGRQMVESMNAAGMDFVVFGNHEFDISEEELQNRMNESTFQWVASNTFHQVKDSSYAFRKLTPGAYEALPEYLLLNLTDEDGTTAKIGVIGLTLNSNKAAYVHYEDPFVTARRLYEKLKDSCDALIAVTHQTIAMDDSLASAIPGLALIIGGHEHNMQFRKVGNVFITKAHSNARSAYIIKLDVDKKAKRVLVQPALQMITDSIANDPATEAVVKRWMDIADSNYATLGFDPRKVLIESGEPLDGRESEIRNGETNLTQLVAKAMKAACPEADIVCYNAGSIRLDDILSMPVLQYDILRTMPFGGGIHQVDVKGDFLRRILNAGMMNKNGGGYLHCLPAAYNTATGAWQVNGEEIDNSKIYRVGLSDYLLTGMEANLDFLRRGNPEILKVYEAEKESSNPRSDIRLAVVKYLEEISH